MTEKEIGISIDGHVATVELRRPPNNFLDVELIGELASALEALDQDREFLKKGGVFTDDVIDAYIALKMQEVTRLRMTTHPIEFDMYYSL